MRSLERPCAPFFLLVNRDDLAICIGTFAPLNQILPRMNFIGARIDRDTYLMKEFRFYDN